MEPVSGAIVDARVKIQTNVLIPDWTFVNSSISYYNMSHSLLPVFTTLYRSQLTQVCGGSSCFENFCWVGLFVGWCMFGMTA